MKEYSGKGIDTVIIIAPHCSHVAIHASFVRIAKERIGQLHLLAAICMHDLDVIHGRIGHRDKIKNQRNVNRRIII